MPPNAVLQGLHYFQSPMKLYFLVIGGLILIISACGQTGPLVLADHPTKDDQPALSSKAPETTENSHKPPEQSP